MAERKSGPVKPPVIDLKAREADKPAVESETAAPKPEPAQPKAESAQPEAKPARPAARPERAEAKPAQARTAEAQTRPAQAETEPARASPPPRPQARLAMPWSAISIAAIGGAFLGAGLVYALGNWLPLPNDRPLIADPAGRLDLQDAEISEVAARIASIEEQGRRTQVSLDATITQLDTGLAELREAIGTIPVAEPVDIVPLQQQLQSLEDRVTAIGAGASSADATALAGTISNIEAELAALRDATGGSTDRASEVDEALAALRDELAALQTAVSTQPTGTGASDIGPAVRLPLVVSGLESAVANGRPFTAELQSLGTLLPNLVVPAALTGSAEAGLPRPDSVVRQFEAAVPDILAGRAAQSSGDMGTDALEWMKGLLALRPVGEVPGDGPEATVSRLEAAVLRRDFAAASALLAALPPSMQAGAGTVGADILALAEADAFLAEVRTRALGPATETTQ
jgi:hypothetical protein